MPAFGPGDIGAGNRAAVTGSGQNDRRVSLLVGRYRGSVRLAGVFIAIGILVRGDHQQDESRPEIPRQPNQQTSLERRRQRKVADSRRHQFFAPNIGVFVLRLRELQVQIFAHIIHFVAGHRGIQRRTVDLILQVVAIALNLVHSFPFIPLSQDFAESTSKTLAVASCRFTLRGRPTANSNFL